jgi:hypothetical protein
MTDRSPVHNVWFNNSIITKNNDFKKMTKLLFCRSTSRCLCTSITHRRPKQKFYTAFVPAPWTMAMDHGHGPWWSFLWRGCRYKHEVRSRKLFLNLKQPTSNSQRIIAIHTGHHNTMPIQLLLILLRELRPVPLPVPLLVPIQQYQGHGSKKLVSEARRPPGLWNGGERIELSKTVPFVVNGYIIQR